MKKIPYTSCLLNQCLSMKMSLCLLFHWFNKQKFYSVIASEYLLHLCDNILSTFDSSLRTVWSFWHFAVDENLYLSLEFATNWKKRNLWTLYTYCSNHHAFAAFVQLNLNNRLKNYLFNPVIRSFLTCQLLTKCNFGIYFCYGMLCREN